MKNVFLSSVFWRQERKPNVLNLFCLHFGNELVFVFVFLKDIVSISVGLMYIWIKLSWTEWYRVWWWVAFNYQMASRCVPSVHLRHFKSTISLLLMAVEMDWENFRWFYLFAPQQYITCLKSDEQRWTRRDKCQGSWISLKICRGSFFFSFLFLNFEREMIIASLIHNVWWGTYPLTVYKM